MLGHQYLLELHDCNHDKINDVATIESCLKKIADATNSDVLTTSSHKFSPQGVTVLNIVRNSHFSFHSWPEYGLAAVDLFVCNGPLDLELCTKLLKDDFECTTISVTLINRGLQY